jgi:hypothetical protein
MQRAATSNRAVRAQTCIAPWFDPGSEPKGGPHADTEGVSEQAAHRAARLRLAKRGTGAVASLAGTIAPLAVVAVAACGGDDLPSQFSVAQAAGCDDLIEEETQEIFVREKFTCLGPDGETTVYTFHNTNGLNSWLEAADEIGVTVVDQGDSWIKVENQEGLAP